MSTVQSPFDPPTPEPVSPVEVVGGMAIVVGLVVADTMTGGLLDLLCAIPAPEQNAASTTIATPEGTAPPNSDGGGDVECTRCAVYVAYPSMSLNEHGYFCSRCTATLVAAAEE